MMHTIINHSSFGGGKVVHSKDGWVIIFGLYNSSSFLIKLSAWNCKGRVMLCSLEFIMYTKKIFVQLHKRHY